ncbi:lantibiotic dehydratase [Mucilaginibacter agri]|uniref:Thiopeptide-type bacteriocin biosynthesis domain-containing protein n=1 Tax=Mucilaginibacter agri TaxID=2695265 RepID=A0A966DU54_9SPHI|nr:lantibiotic dehydratase [Mucilaginibacter agri]NCD70027.1 hypothetical protein [Mucilaginibacter agri]
MKTPLSFLPTLVLRCPFFSPQDYHPARLKDMLHDEYFKQAIYLASPHLFQALAAKQFSINNLTDKERTTLLKYYNRMCFRPTPFGSFSTLSLINWGEQGCAQLSQPGDVNFKLLADQGVTQTLTPFLLSGDSGLQSYRGNPTLYNTGKEFRYIKTQRDKETGKVSYQLEAYDTSRFIKGLLKFAEQSFVNYADIVNYTVQCAGCSYNEARAYTDFLIGAQIIVPQLTTSILGKDALQQLATSPALMGTPIAIAVDAINRAMKPGNFPALAHIESAARDFAALYSVLNEPLPKQWFYSSVERQVTGTLSNNYQQQLSEALNALNILNQPIQDSKLTDFVEKFKTRYDRQKVPLLQALDPESGLSYGPPAPYIINTLLEDVQFYGAKETEVSAIKWSTIHRLILQKWQNVTGEKNEIRLLKSDLEKLEKPQQRPMPASMPILFSTHKSRVIIEAAGGASALSIIGRFTQFSPSVLQIANTIADIEQQNNPGVIFAEINHLSDDHTDNINRRRSVYNYEIPLTQTSANLGKQQLFPADLLLFVDNNELVLESASLQKRVIPRFSSAYNHNINQLSLFQFLCDLQHQNIQSNFTFDIENLFPGMSSYPRVTYQDTILCLAKWNLCEKDIIYLCPCNNEEALSRLEQWRNEFNLPRFVTLSKSDQQLVFDLDDHDSALLFTQCLKSNSKAVIREYIGVDENVKDHRGYTMVNQFIALMVSGAPTYSALVHSPETKAIKTTRNFIPGSKWLYLKIYCAQPRANELLIRVLFPLLKNFNTCDITSWFFVRYMDSGPHIRLRFLVTETGVNYILPALKAKLSADISYNLVHEYQADIYRRELERYGADLIDDVEQCFAASSQLIIHYLKLNSTSSFCYSYHSLAFVSVAEIVDLFFPFLADQINFLNQMANTFYQEHHDQKNLKLSLDRKYRILKDEIAALLHPDSLYYETLRLTQHRIKLFDMVWKIVRLCDKFSHERKVQLAADLIHMHLNRLFAEQQRTQEMIVYHCLLKHHRTIQARNNQQIIVA